MDKYWEKWDISYFLIKIVKNVQVFVGFMAFSYFLLIVLLSSLMRFKVKKFEMVFFLLCLFLNIIRSFRKTFSGVSVILPGILLLFIVNPDSGMRFVTHIYQTRYFDCTLWIPLTTVTLNKRPTQPVFNWNANDINGRPAELAILSWRHDKGFLLFLWLSTWSCV